MGGGFSNYFTLLLMHFFFLSRICLWKIGLAYDPGSLVCLGERNELENNYCDV